MKTPRQLLLERHCSAEPKLDAIRETVLAGMQSSSSGTLSDQESPEAVSWSTLLYSFRWHMAGLSAAWLVILLFHAASTATPASVMAKQKPASPRQILLALRENRRQLVEWLDLPNAEPSVLLPQRRSELDSPGAAASV